ncbi:hypothetical protein D3C77_505950 [compost metagenome]
MVPLPIQCKPIVRVYKFVTDDKRPFRGLRQINLKLLRYLTVNAKDGPSTFPSHRYQTRDSADGVMILKQHRKPFVRRCIENAPLGNSFVMVAHIVVQYNFAFIRAEKLPLTIAYLPAAPIRNTRQRPFDEQQIIIPIYLIGMAAFASQSDSLPLRFEQELVNSTQFYP